MYTIISMSKHLSYNNQKQMFMANIKILEWMQFWILQIVNYDMVIVEEHETN